MPRSLLPIRGREGVLQHGRLLFLRMGRLFSRTNVSKHVTKTASVSTKFEWRIEEFRKLIRHYKPGQSISSKTFILPQLQAVWQLDVYPRGLLCDGYANFDLRLIGFQAPDGSLSADKDIMADYKIYLLNSANGKIVVSQDVINFKIDKTARSITVVEIAKFIHPDGSLFIICEIESLAPEQTFSMESSPAPGLLDQSVQLSDHIREMWKSKLFTDCTLEVGSKSFPAHKCILGQWSEVFCKMFSLPLEEAKSGIVEIEDFGPDAISAMLEYMYTGLVKNEVMNKLAPELLALSEKYAVIPLKEMCEVFMASKLTTTNILQIVILADRFLASKLKKACVNRLAIDGRAVLQSKEWDDLKSKDKDLANELLELMIKDQLLGPRSFKDFLADVPEDTKETK